MLSGARPDRKGQPLLDRSFPKALSIGVKFKGIVLNPNSNEAEFRSNVETPNTAIDKRLLQCDADFVRNDLWLMYKRAGIEENMIRNLKLRYTNIGISFSLWLFNDVAFIEPMHFGKREGDEHLCGFCRLKITRFDSDTPNPQNLYEYQTIEEQFRVLWNNSEDISLEKVLNSGK